MKRYCLVLFAAAVLLCGCDEKRKSLTKGSVTLESVPAGAEVFAGTRTLGKTPLPLTGTPGYRRVRLEKKGYQTRWADFKIEPARKNFVKVNMPEQGIGVLVNSRPDMVNVSIDGRELGVTPLIIPDVMPGRYELKFAKPGFAGRSLYLDVKGTRPQNLIVDVVSNMGQVRLSSKPSKANISINGKSYGVTPFSGSLPAGVYRVRLEKAGVMPMEEVIEVQSGKVCRKEFVMPVAPGAVEVVTHPAGAQIRLDGRIVGTAPLKLKELPAGKYRITASMTGYGTAEKKVEILPDATARVDFALSTSNGSIHLSIVPAGVSVYLNGRFLGKVRSEPGAAVNRTEPIRVNGLAPGVYRVTVAHELGDPERKHVDVRVRKGMTSRPEPIYLWVPNAEVKWKNSGKVETGMLYSETADRFVFGADKGIRTDYSRQEVEYIRKININEKEEK